MRLLDTTTLELRDFYLSDIPPYAILSHTWSDGEVTFQEMSSPTRTLKKGFVKIAKTCELALLDGLAYAWVDTCCIDKSSSAELSEAINSMYQWYSKAEACYIYLEDLHPGNIADFEERLPSCRWFTRGWTLQELLAPKSASNVHFFDTTWNYRGPKADFIDILSACTGISSSIMAGSSGWNLSLTDCSIAEKMSWAAKRETTRIEDTAYCLLGIFNVNMPLLYGEGMKAFRRLQEEIIKRNNDLTIFAWEDPQLSFRLFAESPAAFVNSSDIRPFRDDCEDFSLTNKGLFVFGEAPLREVSILSIELGHRVSRYALSIGYSTMREAKPVGRIYLLKIGPKLFVRDLTWPLVVFLNLNFDETRTLDDMSD